MGHSMSRLTERTRAAPSSANAETKAVSKNDTKDNPSASSTTNEAETGAANAVGTGTRDGVAAADVPSGLPTSTAPEYSFPTSQLRRELLSPEKTPLVLVACGSFSPITVLHLQLFELAQRYVEGRPELEIVGNYLSPCSDSYGKSSLAAARHRTNMCALAIEERGCNVMVDEWEILRRDDAGKPVYTPTVDVVTRLDTQINDVLGGIRAGGGFKKAKVMLLIGADLALTMADPVVWPTADVDVLLGRHGALVVERPNQCDIKDVVKALHKYEDNFCVVPSFENDVSSTRVRAQIRNGEDAVDLPRAVFHYIKEHRLYQDVPAASPAKAPNGSA